MGIVTFLLDWLFPPRCTFCKKEGDFLCEECVTKLVIRPIRHRKVHKEWQYLDGVIYAVDYEKNPAIKVAIRQFKYKFTQPLAQHFGALMTQKLAELNMIRGRDIVLIPVPLHPRRLRYRGFNQADVLARSIKNIAHIVPALTRVKDTNQQAKLNKKARKDNLKDAFKLNKNFVQEQNLCSINSLVFLVDDVCTTGATLENAAKVLKTAGIPKVYGLVVARAFK